MEVATVRRKVVVHRLGTGTGVLLFPLGLERFTAFRSSIGEGLVFFGQIELFVFVRTSDLKDGFVKPLNDWVNNVKTGINLGLDKAPNKG